MRVVLLGQTDREVDESPRCNTSKRIFVMRSAYWYIHGLLHKLLLFYVAQGVDDLSFLICLGNNFHLLSYTFDLDKTFGFCLNCEGGRLTHFTKKSFCCYQSCGY